MAIDNPASAGCRKADALVRLLCDLGIHVSMCGARDLVHPSPTICHGVLVDGSVTGYFDRRSGTGEFFADIRGFYLETGVPLDGVGRDSGCGHLFCMEGHLCPASSQYAIGYVHHWI